MPFYYFHVPYRDTIHTSQWEIHQGNSHFLSTILKGNWPCVSECQGNYPVPEISTVELQFSEISSLSPLNDPVYCYKYLAIKLIAKVAKNVDKFFAKVDHTIYTKYMIFAVHCCWIPFNCWNIHCWVFLKLLFEEFYNNVWQH